MHNVFDIGLAVRREYLTLTLSVEGCTGLKNIVHFFSMRVTKFCTRGGSFMDFPRSFLNERSTRILASRPAPANCSVYLSPLWIVLISNRAATAHRRTRAVNWSSLIMASRFAVGALELPLSPFSSQCALHSLIVAA
jgi:hypothetical protein